MRLSKKACLEDARKYKTAKDWMNNSPHVFAHMDSNDWLEDVFNSGLFHGRRPPGYWTFARCKREASKYKTRSDWMRGSSASYTFAVKKKWNDELSSNMILKSTVLSILKTKWTKELCAKYSKKYNKRSEWQDGHPPTYHVAGRNGWKEELCCHMISTEEANLIASKARSKWDKESCRKESIKYETRSDWIRGSGSSYNSARKNKWLQELCTHMLSTSEVISRQHRYWTKELCEKEALKYDQISKWQKAKPGSYSAALENNWLGSCTSHMKVILNKWTKEACLADALKYTRKGEWHKKSAGAFSSARRNGWAKECMAHMRHFRTLEDCKADALKYKTRDQWARLSPGPYWSAQSHGWVDECCSGHMTDRANCDLREKRAVDKLVKMIEESVTKDIKREENLGTGFPDLTLEINGKIVIVEVKHDHSRWHRSEIKDQINKYDKDGRKKYKNKFVGCYLTSPYGKYGYDFKTLIEGLKEIK